MTQNYNVQIDNAGTVRWFIPGTNLLHRENGPAVEYIDGSKYWYENGLLHREDYPAIECSDRKCWYQNGKYHRMYGPAVDIFGKFKCWYQYGKKHRLDGPAVEYYNGNKFWYIDDKEYTENEFNKLNLNI